MLLTNSIHDFLRQFLPYSSTFCRLDGLVWQVGRYYFIYLHLPAHLQTG